jgi:hypothetical protein
VKHLVVAMHNIWQIFENNLQVQQKCKGANCLKLTIMGSPCVCQLWHIDNLFSLGFNFININGFKSMLIIFLVWNVKVEGWCILVWNVKTHGVQVFGFGVLNLRIQVQDIMTWT